MKSHWCIPLEQLKDLDRLQDHLNHRGIEGEAQFTLAGSLQVIDLVFSIDDM